MRCETLLVSAACISCTPTKARRCNFSSLSHSYALLLLILFVLYKPYFEDHRIHSDFMRNEERRRTNLKE